MSMESRYASAGIASWVTSLQQPPFSTSNTAKIHGAAEHMYCANRTVRVIMIEMDDLQARDRVTMPRNRRNLRTVQLYSTITTFT